MAKKKKKKKKRGLQPHIQLWALTVDYCTKNSYIAIMVIWYLLQDQNTGRDKKPQERNM
jgi:hypothetical protein